jgi:hypothetical protein
MFKITNVVCKYHTKDKMGERDMKTIIVAESTDMMEKLGSMAGKLPEMELAGIFQDEFAAARFINTNKIDLVLFDATVFSQDFTGEDSDDAAKKADVSRKQNKRNIYVRTFGHFDVFVEGQPIMFKSAKAKELLAFLVDRRGGTVTTDQMISVLWENRPNDESTQNLCSKLVKTLRNELQASGAEEMLVVSRGNRRVDTDTFRCDLYEFLDGSEKVRNQYMGEYLLDYSWSETRTALLDRFLH